MFPVPEVEARLRKFVLAKLWINDRDPAARSAAWKAMLEERFGTTAIPLYAILTPGDEVVGSLAFPGGTPASFVAPMAAFLDRGLEAVRK